MTTYFSSLEEFHPVEHGNTGCIWNTKESYEPVAILALPNFSKKIMIEIDTSGEGISAVLMQDGHPIIDISKALSSKNQVLSIYEKVMFAILYAIKK